MRKRFVLSILAVATLIIALCGMAYQAGTDGVDAARLREMLVQLGYTVNDLNKDKDKEKYEVTLVKGGLNIPVGVEVSPSKNYIWLTVSLGDVPSSDKSLALLKQNGIIQPCQFYVTSKDRLMCGLPIDNRTLDNALLRKRIEFITDKVSDTQSIWNK